MPKTFPNVHKWFSSREWEVFDFQREAWDAFAEGKSGLVNAPTGSGKTYSLMVPSLCQYEGQKNVTGLRVIWIAPIRALAKEIEISATRLIDGLNLSLEVGIRTGDTTVAQRAKMKKKRPQLLITTPESIHVMLAQRDYAKVFGKLDAVIVDEWHELIGSKRGVQVELALSRFRGMNPELKTWGISATIGNLAQGMDVLLGPSFTGERALIQADIQKNIEVKTIIPDDFEIMPWAGHIGVKLIDEVVPIINKSDSTLIFTNTRAQCEIWFHRLLDAAPDLAGTIAMHHGSISRELRQWVEQALYDGDLKAVVCTSSLDLGVDFRPVDNIIQVGGPKGVSRFVQRAGRSGHRPGAKSRIYFLPTHSMELIEAAALRQAIKDDYLEAREPYMLTHDVLIQYLMTLGVSGGFQEQEVFEEIKNTFVFSEITREEWEWSLRFITTGGESLAAYPEYKKAVREKGWYEVVDRKIARRHRMSIGTIVGDHILRVRYKNGRTIGNIEESFLSSVNSGDTFWFAGQNLELLRIVEMDAIVIPSKKKSGKVPVWGGGRLSFSSNMTERLRQKLNEIVTGKIKDVELLRLKPMIDVQRERSFIPSYDELLIEYFESKQGFHLLFYPLEGRLIHEGMAHLMAYRISQIEPRSFSMSFNDYGFELLCDIPIPIREALEADLFSDEDLFKHLQASINAGEMARRKFRDIAVIAGLIFKGYPGMPVRERHIQASSSLVFDVFEDYDSENLLLRQAYNEVIDHQLEFVRFRNMIRRLRNQNVVFATPELPTPFAFPIIADRLRQRLSTEDVEDRIARMSIDYGD